MNIIMRINRHGEMDYIGKKHTMKHWTMWKEEALQFSSADEANRMADRINTDTSTGSICVVINLLEHLDTCISDMTDL